MEIKEREAEAMKVLYKNGFDIPEISKLLHKEPYVVSISIKKMESVI